MSAIKRLPEYDDFREELVVYAVRGMVHDVRHADNIKMRREAGEFGGPAKVGVGAAVQQACQNVYAYFIAGTTLGMILGSQLSEIANSEAAKADGHLFNTRLCRRLARLVPANKTVKQAVKESVLAKIFREEEDKT